MANVRNSNSYYIDTAAADTAAATTGNLAIQNLKVSYIVITSNGGAGQLILKDVTTGALKLDLKLASDNNTQVIDLSEAPLVFPNGISPTTVTNCVATCIARETRG